MIYRRSIVADLEARLHLSQVSSSQLYCKQTSILLHYHTQVVVSQVVSNSVPGWIYGATLCPILHFLNVWTMGVGIFTMCFLALMRFVGLVLPFWFRKSFLSSPGRVARLVIVIALWMTGAILASPNLYYFHLITGERCLFFSLCFCFGANNCATQQTLVHPVRTEIRTHELETDSCHDVIFSWFLGGWCWCE